MLSKKDFRSLPGKRIPGEAKYVKTYAGYTRDEPDAGRGQKNHYSVFSSLIAPF
jgi:hypothetical protein